MFLLRSFEFLLVIALILVIGTQVMWPLWRNRPLWPWFTGRTKAESTVGEAVEDKEVEALERRARILRANQTQRGRIK